MSTATADRATQGYGLAHDEGEAFWLLGMLQTVKVGRADAPAVAARASSSLR